MKKYIFETSFQNLRNSSKISKKQRESDEKALKEKGPRKKKYERHEGLQEKGPTLPSKSSNKDKESVGFVYRERLRVGKPSHEPRIKWYAEKFFQHKNHRR